MSLPLEACLVRIYSQHNRAIGAGCLVSSKYVVTCAHVVADALGLSRTTSEQPDGEIFLDFPLIAPQQRLRARVVRWLPLNPQTYPEDIAGLEIIDTVPETAKQVELVRSNSLWNRNFRVCGFPNNQAEGVWASGRLMATTANGWVQLEATNSTGYRLEPGFSGAPIWDEGLNAVVGIAVAADLNRPEAGVGFIRTYARGIENNAIALFILEA